MSKSQMKYPENCIKGIPNSSYLSEDSLVLSHLFHFKIQDSREDGWIENSVNWEDDENAIDFTLGKRKNGDFQFKAGVAIVQRSELDRLKDKPSIKGLLDYERARLPDNNYHGNILIRKETKTATMKKIAAGIALAVTNICKGESG